MNNRILFLSALMLCSVICRAGDRSHDPDLVMRYDEPAGEWVEALPLGNGRLGAMVFGRPHHELIQLNEESLWAGGPVDPDPNPEAVGYLDPIRKVLFAGDYSLGGELCRKMQGYYTESYAPLGDLIIDQSFTGEAAGYYRDLDLNTATATTRFSADGIEYRREVFISAPDQVIVVRLSSDMEGKLDFAVRLSSPLQSVEGVADRNTIVMDGRAPAHAEPSYVESPEPLIYSESAGMRFRLLCRVASTDGRVSAAAGTLTVSDATEAVILLSAATSFNGFDKDPVADGKDEKRLAAAYLDKASEVPFREMLNRHIADYKSYFDRVSFELGEHLPAADRTIPARLDDYLTGGEDLKLEKLYFQYCRYLLICCSRPGGIAANLQGIWNNEVRPPWSSNYTTNINAQMNYWPAEPANLAETHLPFLDLIRNMSINGSHTARNFYGAGGWCLHHNSDIWAQTNPVGNIGEGMPMWANWMMGGPWVCQHLYEHYRFNPDIE